MPTADGHRWANVIRDMVDDEHAAVVILGINELMVMHRIKRASLIVACAQMLAQEITGADPDIAPEVRRGIMALIDGYAMQDTLTK